MVFVLYCISHSIVLYCIVFHIVMYCIHCIVFHIVLYCIAFIVFHKVSSCIMIPGALNATVCPMGTMNNNTGGQNLSDCRPCLPGYFCGSTGLSYPSGECEERYYCPDRAIIDVSRPTGYACPPGFTCPRNTDIPVPCKPGKWEKIQTSSRLFIVKLCIFFLFTMQIQTWIFGILVFVPFSAILSVIRFPKYMQIFQK